MTRKVVDFIEKNKTKVGEVGDDMAAFVNSASSSRRPVPGKQSNEGAGGTASSNPFGSF